MALREGREEREHNMLYNQILEEAFFEIFQRLSPVPWGCRAGKNLVLTCRAQVPNPDLVRELRWFHPSGNQIRQDER